MPFNEDLEPKGKKGKRLRILSIDGGAVRGIIPAKILEVLEGYLRELDEKTKEHHLYEYFDLIAGTSSGGLITALITTRNVKDLRLPTCDATQLVQFFEKDAPKIFPNKFTNTGCLRWLLEGFESVLGPIYCAGPLKALLHKTLGAALLSEALTDVIIPAFDTQDQVPVFFSNLKGVDEANPLYNVPVKDACLATTAVPILLPAAHFEGQVTADGPKVFNVIDGGIAVNDPTLVAVTQVIAEERQAIENERSQEGSEMDFLDFNNVLVLSLGTGQHRMRFVANPYWSSVKWLVNRSGSPLLSSFLSASEDMVEYYTSMILDAHKSGGHYLRIQTELWESEFLKIDDARRKNLKQLEAALVQSETRKPLHSFARLLVKERLKREESKVISGEGESSRSGEFGRTRRRRPRGEVADITLMVEVEYDQQWLRVAPRN